MGDGYRAGGIGLPPSPPRAVCTRLWGPGRDQGGECGRTDVSEPPTCARARERLNLSRMGDENRGVHVLDIVRAWVDLERILALSRHTSAAAVALAEFRVMRWAIEWAVKGTEIEPVVKWIEGLTFLGIYVILGWQIWVAMVKPVAGGRANELVLA